MGTPLWLSPEAIATGKYSTKTDVWSLGITAIEAHDMYPPNFDVSSVSRAIYLIPTSPPPTLRTPAEASVAFNAFLARCLKKEPDARPTAAVSRPATSNPRQTPSQHVHRCASFR